MANHLDRLFSALSDTTRRAVVERLTNGPATVSDLHEPYSMALPTFMRHLKVLEDSGLITSQKLGRVRTITLAPKALATIDEWLGAHRRLWASR